MSQIIAQKIMSNTLADGRTRTQLAGFDKYLFCFYAKKFYTQMNVISISP